MAKFPKAAATAIAKLKAQIKDEKAKAAKATKAAKAADKGYGKATAKLAKKTKVKKAQQVFAAGDWTGAAPKKLTIYKVRLMLDEQQIGIFGPYATIRAASADAKNVLRMHVGPDYKIEEIGVDEPLLRSDGKIKVYFHPSVYSAQATDKGVLTAQVIEQGGEAQRKKTFVKKYNPSGKGSFRGHLSGADLALAKSLAKHTGALTWQYIDGRPALIARVKEARALGLTGLAAANFVFSRK